MKTYWRLLGFAKPIEKFAIPYFFYTLFYAFFNAFTLVLIMPVVTLLFQGGGMIETVTELPPFALNEQYMTSLLNYLLYSIFGGDYTLTNVLMVLAGILVVAAFMANLFRYLGQYTAESMRIHALKKLRNSVYDNIINLNLGFFGNERKGDIISRIMSDVQVVQYCITNTLQIVFREPFLIIFYVFAMVNISWELTIFSVVYLPVVGLIISVIVKRLRKVAKIAQERFGDITTVVDETVSGMKVIKAYNAEGFFNRRFQDLNDLYSRTVKKIVKRNQLASPMSEFLGITAVAGLLVFGGTLVLNNTLTGSEFIAYIGIFTQIIRPVRSFTDAFSNINQGIAAGERVFSLLDTKSPIANSPDAAELVHFSNNIDFRDVRFSYENKEVIKGVNFTIEKGESVALVGPSGGGKTTLSDLIPRFYEVQGGEILIDGRNIKDYSMHSLRAQMGIVSQDTILFNDTIENNIRLGNTTATHEEVVAAARVANADMFIDECEQGYDTNIGDRGSKLSGGQRQRLSIARAVLKNPEILILDEATSALDTESEKLVQQALDSLLKGRTSIVIAHRLSTIQNADKILVVERGEVTEVGTHEELLARGGTYSKLIEMQKLK